MLFTIARTGKQPRCPSTDEWIKKLWYIYLMEYYSAIKGSTFESVLMRWTNVEPITQSRVNQKCNYHMFSHIYGIWKVGTGELIFRAAMEKQKTDLRTQGGEEEEGEMYGERNMEIYNTICKTDSQQEFSV